MNKKWYTVFLIAVVLFIGVTVLFNYNLKSRYSPQKLNMKRDAVSEKDNSVEENFITMAQSVVSTVNPSLTEMTVPVTQGAELSLIDEGYAERIRVTMSGDDMVVLGVYPVGEDTQESMKRFFLCNGRYHAEFYLADYITGKISDLSSRNPSIDISYYVRDDDDQLMTAYVDWEIQIEDYDGNGELDILLVLPFDRKERERGFYYIGGVLLWLQKQGDFQPVNRSYCGYYSGWWESEFSVKIAELEEKFKEEQNPDAWDIDKVSAWVREELLEGQTENLNKTLGNPKNQLPYDQRREPGNLHPELVQDAQGHYSVRIAENPYSEGRINEWLKDFYENDEEAEKEFMGVTREDEETMTEQERLDAGFYYNTSVWPERVDDATLCLRLSTYEYSGGVHGNDFTYAVVFDTRSGEVVRLDDVVKNRERFIKFAMDYFEANYESYSWEKEEIRESLRYERWCFTDYGFKVFWNGGNGSGIYSCEIPYELLTDYLKEEYLPTSPAAVYGIYYWEYNQTEGKVRMDVNGDGEVDTIVLSALEEAPIMISVNGTESELELQYQGKSYDEMHVRIQNALFERQEDGRSKLNLKVSLWSKEAEISCMRVYVYRIEGEDVIFETDYEVDE